ncbi:MAG: hypothetical protein M0R30_03245 [Methanoregula sp.]|jgi:hypothetical protein|uniref:hypothetical protein n=1 Tax=Methanoregula sp. TaxID=2052170 RepID=UPI0025DA206D|nr:hypothetical protein [Methanoregula sp.]MCK9630637.1 hypothetical protein [Methanoregula sp.]
MTEKNDERKMEGEESMLVGAGIHETLPETPAGRGTAMKLSGILCPEAREELTRHGITELVSVTVKAVPDPDRPEDRLAMKIITEVNDNFQPGIPAIDLKLDKADRICSSAGDDLSLSLRDELLVTLETRRRELAELRNGMVDGKPVAVLSNPEIAALIRPSLENPDIDALVWSIGWCVTSDSEDPRVFSCFGSENPQHDEGRLLVYSDDPLISEEVDEDSWVRIRDRMRRVDYVIEGLVAGLMGEG